MIEVRLGEKRILSGALILGYFDCVHIGHLALIKEGKRDGKAYCFTFNTDISDELPKKSPNVYSYEERLIRMNYEGVDGVIYAPFDEKIKNMEAKDFLDELCKTVDVKKAVCGKDFRFGKEGLGNADFLTEYFLEKGVKTVVVADVLFDGKKVSTGRVFEELSNGEIEKANALLSRNYFKLCKVLSVDGDKNRTVLSPKSGSFRLKDGNYKGLIKDEEVGITIKNNMAYIDKKLPDFEAEITLTFTERG